MVSLFMDSVPRYETWNLSGSTHGTQSETVSKLSGFPVPSAACSLVILDRSIRVVFVTESSVQCEPKEKHEDYKNFHATLHSVCVVALLTIAISFNERCPVVNSIVHRMPVPRLRPRHDYMEVCRRVPVSVEGVSCISRPSEDYLVVDSAVFVDVVSSHPFRVLLCSHLKSSIKLVR